VKKQILINSIPKQTMPGGNNEYFNKMFEAVMKNEYRIEKGTEAYRWVHEQISGKGADTYESLKALIAEVIRGAT
jgi:hypothetical protein